MIRVIVANRILVEEDALRLIERYTMLLHSGDSCHAARDSESARGVLGSTPQQACPVLDTGKDEGNPAKRGTDGRFSAAC